MTNQNQPNRNPSRDVFEGVDPAIRIRTKKMLMYFIVFAVVMLFAGFTSAYVVSNMGQYWVNVQPTSAFWVSNVLLVISSLTLWWSVRSMRADNKQQTLIALLLTLFFGVAFTVSQSEGWKSLSDIGLGWTTTDHESGMKAYRWNSIESLLQSDAIYGQDYTITRGGEPILFDAAKKRILRIQRPPHGASHYPQRSSNVEFRRRILMDSNRRPHFTPNLWLCLFGN
jgi:hypothetical protein